MSEEQENNIHCQYCNEPAGLVGGDVIYPHREDLYHLKFWNCSPCGAYVGCHKAGNNQGDGTKPLGVLANKDLRKVKYLAHASFDTIWKSKMMSRKEAYSWLAWELQVPKKECHIGMFTIQQCEKIVEKSRLKLREYNGR